MNEFLSNNHSDDEASNHEDASDTGAAPKQQQQVIPQTTAISNIKRLLQEEEEYENGNFKKIISTRKDGVIRILPPVTAAEIQAIEKERKAKNILLTAIPKEHMRRFHGMDDAKETWEAIRTSSEGLEKGYDRFQQLLSQLEAHGAEVSTEDANHKFLKLRPDMGNLAMTMRTTKPRCYTYLLMMLYRTLMVLRAGNPSTCNPSISSTNIPEKEALAGFADEVIYSLFAKQSEDWDLLHEDLEQIIYKKRTGGESQFAKGKYNKGHMMEKEERLFFINPKKSGKTKERIRWLANNGYGSIGTSSEHSVDLEFEISRVPQEVLSHLIKDCNYYEKKMAREAAPKKQRVFNTGNRVTKPVWNNADSELNNANHFGSYISKYSILDHPLKNMVDRGIFDSGCSRYMTGNKDQQEDFEEFNRGSVTFGGSKGYINGKGRIRGYTMFTNHNRLQHILDQKELNMRPRRLLRLISDFDGKIRYHPNEARVEALKKVNVKDKNLHGMDKEFENRLDGTLCIRRRSWLPHVRDLGELVQHESHKPNYFIHLGIG
ncbi:hypothetical protein Tco_1492581 [Tanacetum coccineum]